MINVDDFIGIPWKDGETDCYGLARSLYKAAFNLDLTDYARPTFWWLRNPEMDLLRSNFQNEGFQIFHGTRREMQFGDGILMAMRSSIINHVGFYLGGGWMLHHPFREKSAKVSYAGEWLDRTMIVCRHPQAKIDKAQTTIQLIDLLPAHKQRAINDVIS